MIYLALSVAYLTVLAEILFKDRSLIVIIPYGIIVPMLFFIPRLVKNAFEGSFEFSSTWLEMSDTLYLALLLVSAPGSLFFYEMGFQYDRFVHLFTGFLCFILAYILFLPIFKKYGFSKSKSLIILGLVGFIGTFAWELFQWSTDQIFGTHLFHDAVQPIQVDTTEDIIFGCIGIAGALFFLGYNYKFFSGLVKKRKKK